MVELLAALAVLAVVTAAGLAGWRAARDAVRLRGAAGTVETVLGHARLLAVSRRQTVRIRVDARGDLVLVAPDGSVLDRAPVGRGRELRVDSLRIRPPWLRYNARGHGGAGSIYLYAGRRGVRVVSNFLGRIRRENFVIP